MDDAPKFKLALFAIGIVGYGVWTALLMFAALIAESGGKDSHPWMAALALWPLGELAWTWVWLLRHQQAYAMSVRRGLGEALVVVSLVLPVLLLLLGLFLDIDGRWPLGIFASMAVAIAGCHMARFLWSRSSEVVAGS